MKNWKKIAAVAAIIAVLAGVTLYAVYAANEPKIKVIATETATEVNVEVKASGNIAKLDSYTVYVGYSNAKLAYKANSANVSTPDGWTLDSFTDNTDYADASVGYVTIANALNLLENTGTTIAVSAGGDVTLATFTFTKKSAVTASDIFQKAGGFRYNPMQTLTKSTWVSNDDNKLTVQASTLSVDHSFTAYSAGTPTPTPNVTNPGTSLWVKSVQNSGGTAYGNMGSGIAAGSTVTVKNNKAAQVSAILVINLYDTNDRLMKSQNLAAVGIAAGAEANIPIPAAIDTTGAKTLEILPYANSIDPAKPGGTELVLGRN